MTDFSPSKYRVVRPPAFVAGTHEPERRTIWKTVVGSETVYYWPKDIRDGGGDVPKNYVGLPQEDSLVIPPRDGKPLNLAFSDSDEGTVNMVVEDVSNKLYTVVLPVVVVEYFCR